MLPRAIPKPAKRASRWKSPAHLNFVRSRACSVCGSVTNIEAAHVRLGSGAGVGQKPDDWRAVSLCGGPHSNIDGQLGCHNRQHIIGEQTFWAECDVEALIAAFIKASPKRHEIEAIRRERGNG
jgi:hypothetical protein